MKFMHYIGVTVVLLSQAATALAHTQLQSSSPKDQAVVMGSPQNLELHFTAAMRLIKLRLIKTSDKATTISLNFRPSQKAVRSFSQPLPKLEPGSYAVEWVAMGKDAHKMEGTLSFDISQDTSYLPPLAPQADMPS